MIPARIFPFIDHPRVAPLWRLAKFMIVGGSGVIVNLVVLYVGWLLLRHTPMGYRWAAHSSALAGFLVSVFTNFLLNDNWTWGDRAKGDGRDLWRRVGKYYLASALGGALQMGVFVFLFERYGLHPVLAKGAGIVLATALNFVVSHYWAFRASAPPVQADVVESSPGSSGDCGGGEGASPR